MKSFKQMRIGGEVKRFDAMKIKLQDIHPEPGFNIRERTPELEAHIEAIKDFILNGGSLPALEVRPREEGGVWVVDGHCRREAYERAVKAGAPIEWIDIKPFEGDDADRIARMATSNEGLKLTPLENAGIYKRLRGMGLEAPEIAKLVNKSPQHVMQMLALADANQDLKQHIRSGIVSPTTAVKMVKKHGPRAGAKVIELHAKSGKKKVTEGMVERTVRLSENERLALDMLVSAHHAKWKDIAEGFMTEDERRNLEARLAE